MDQLSTFRDRYRSYFLIVFFFGNFLMAAGQVVKNAPPVIDENNSTWADESIFRERLRKDGLTEATINRLIQQHKIMVAQGRKVDWRAVKKSRTPRASNVCSACQDMGGEGGWGQWSGDPGINEDNVGLVFTGAVAPYTPRFNLTTGPGIDAETPGPNPGDPVIPVVAPGFGNFSIQLGELETNGQLGGCDTTLLNASGCAERIIYPLQVSPVDTNFVYTYAFVMENPGISHTYLNMPYVEFMILDALGDTIPCAYQRYAASDTIPGMYYGNHIVDGPTAPIYKPWTLVGVNLSAYVGQCLSVVITNADCQLSGHFAHSYWDFSCGSISSLIAPTCTNGRPDTLTAPVSDPLNPYTYDWYVNGNPNSIGNTQIITYYTQPGDTFTVRVNPASGCGWNLVYIPQHYHITSNFSFAGTCGAMTFTDHSTSPQPTDPVTGWQWIFPGGTPSSSTLRNPGVVTFPAGTYTVTLIAMSSTGCVDTMQQTFSIGGFPTADFNSTSPCLGASTSLTDGSVQSGTDPITSWSWTMAGAIPATSIATSPSIVYNTAGVHNVTLIVTSQSGCADTITKQVTVWHLPIASFNDRDSGCAPICHSFTDLSQPVDGNLTTWQWSFPGGNPASSSSQNPANICYTIPGTYNGSLIVTTSYGCKDTIQQNRIIIAYPYPHADFTSAGICGAMTFTDHSTVTDPSYPIATWNWSFPGGNPVSSASQNPGIIHYAPGSYTVTLTVTNSSGCVNIKQYPIVVAGKPTAELNYTSPCLGSATTLNGSSSSSSVLDPIVNYSWTMNGGLPSAGTGISTSTVYDSAGTHFVTLIVTTQNGCRDTITRQVNVYRNPVAVFNDHDAGCIPVCHDYRDLSTSIDGTIAQWQWSFPGSSSDTSSSQNPLQICYKSVGNYDASLTVTSSYGCRSTISLVNIIHAYPWPKANFSISSEKAMGTDPVFSFTKLWSPDVVNWTWDFGDGTHDSASTSPVHSYSSTATGNDFYSYDVILYVNNQYGCMDKISRPVELIPYFDFFIPNCFTPNGDLRNEYFYGKGRGIKNYTLWIFDRWGHDIWSCHYDGTNVPWDYYGAEGMPAACQWDGTSNGTMVQQDVYVWRVELVDVFDKQHSYVGRVTVVK